MGRKGETSGGGVGGGYSRSRSKGKREQEIIRGEIVAPPRMEYRRWGAGRGAGVVGEV